MSYSDFASYGMPALLAGVRSRGRALLFISALSSLLLAPTAYAVSGGGGTGATNGVCAQDVSTSSIACGLGGTATGSSGSIALGDNSSASGANGVAIGVVSTASSNNSTALGTASLASGFKSTASGYKSAASGADSTASGTQSSAGGTGDIALGGQASTISSGTQTGGNIAIGSSTGIVAGAGVTNNPTTANGGNSIAIGTGAQATASGAIAIGAGVTNTTANSVSFGSNAVNTTGSLSAGSISTGSINANDGGITHAGTVSGVATNTLTATSTDAVNGSQLYATDAQQATDMANISANTIRLNALVNGQAGTCMVINGGLSCGVNAKTNGANTVALGTNATASYAGSVAIGDGAQANADPTTAIGNNAVANGNNSTAIGADSTANGAGSVALGYGSVANRADSVSVGNSATGLSRQITNVAPGTQPNDAVNLGQLTQYSATVGAVTSSLAEAAAQGAMNPEANSVALASAIYDGQGAMAVSLQHRFGSSWTAGVSVSTDGTAGNTAASVGGALVGRRTPLSCGPLRRSMVVHPQKQRPAQRSVVKIISSLEDIRAYQFYLPKGASWRPAVSESPAPRYDPSITRYENEWHLKP